MPRALRKAVKDPYKPDVPAAKPVAGAAPVAIAPPPAPQDGPDAWPAPSAPGHGLGEVLERLGFNVGTAATFAVGVLLFLVSRLLETILVSQVIGRSSSSSSSSSDMSGLVQASTWISFAASVLVVVALLTAALTARRAGWGARLGLLVLGLYVLVSTNGLASLFGSFAGLLGNVLR